KAEQLPLVDVERDVVNGGNVTELLVDVANADERLGRRVAPWSGIGSQLRLLGHGGSVEDICPGAGRGRLVPSCIWSRHWPALILCQASVMISSYSGECALRVKSLSAISAV